jgi:hypothetical protein
MSKSNQPGIVETVYIYQSYHISFLEGELLTFIDAIISDSVQRKASKDLARRMLWDWAMRNNNESNYEIKKIPEAGNIPTNKIN